MLGCRRGGQEMRRSPCRARTVEIPLPQELRGCLSLPLLRCLALDHGRRGCFAPGHLGELTQYLPFELVDDVLEQTRTVQRRLRDLPSRVGVYFVLALGLFPGWATPGCGRS